MEHPELLLRLVVAALLGGIVGLERHRSEKAAGLRTHALVGLGAALAMIVSAYGFDRVLQPGRVVLDPSRVAAQVISGISFLGAGIILRQHQSIHGLTTAASVWAVAAVGLAAGGGLYLAAAGATVMILITLTALKSLEDRLPVREGRRTIQLVVTRSAFATTEIEAIIRRARLELLGIHARRGNAPPERRLEISLRQTSDTDWLALTEQLQAIEGVIEVRYEDPAL
jgi:putative Mg2+ transporter-C (MgtC) family protein